MDYKVWLMKPCGWFITEFGPEKGLNGSLRKPQGLGKFCGDYY
jgi:hypothetical protein